LTIPGGLRDSLGAPGLEFETWESEKDAVGFVLAGGQSRRMGTDKALVGFRGRPLVAYALDLLRTAGLPVFIAGTRSPLESFAPVVPDSSADAGPLEGICAALESLKDGSTREAASDATRAVFLPVDLPFLPPSLLLYLLYHARITGLDVTLPSVNSFPQTFPVVLSLDCLPMLKRELSSGHRGCYAAFQATAAALGEPLSILPAEMLVQSRKITHPAALPVSRWFFNVNAPADLRRATAISAGRVTRVA
jgi:molybdopterin-guanine dinucleotide biosynthesis protein A